MSLKELKGLAPWQWDSQTKKHAIGPKGLQDFTEITRILQKRPDAGAGSDLTDTQKPVTKRRRSGREGADTSAGNHGIEIVAAPGAAGTATPSIPGSKKFKNQPGRAIRNLTPVPAQSHGRELTPPCWQTPAASAPTDKTHTAAACLRSQAATLVAVSEAQLSLPAAGSAGQLPAAAGCQVTAPLPADAQEQVWHQHHSKDRDSPASAVADRAVAELAIRRQEGPKAAEMQRQQPPTDAFSTPIASAASLLVDAFSPSPIPTPAMPGSTWAGSLVSLATVNLDNRVVGASRSRTRLELVEHNVGKCKQQEVNGAAAGSAADRVTPRGSTFPVPKLQFTPASSMKPPVSRRRSAAIAHGASSMQQQQQQQPLAVAAATAGNKEPSPPAVLSTPAASGCLLMSQARSTPQVSAGAAGFHTPLQPLELLLSAASMESPQDDKAGQGEAADSTQQQQHDGTVSCTVGDAAAATQGRTEDNCRVENISLLLLPAKLRCKGANRSCGAASDSGPGLLPPAKNFASAGASCFTAASVKPSTNAAGNEDCDLDIDQQQLQQDGGCGTDQVDSIGDDCCGFLYELAEAAAAASCMDTESPPQWAATAADKKQLPAPAVPAAILGSCRRSQISPASAGKVGLKRWWRSNLTAAATGQAQQREPGQQELSVQELPEAAQNALLVAKTTPGSSSQSDVAKQQMVQRSSAGATAPTSKLRVMAGRECQAGRHADTSAVNTAANNSQVSAERFPGFIDSPAAAMQESTEPSSGCVQQLQQREDRRYDGLAAADPTAAGAAAELEVPQDDVCMPDGAASCRNLMTDVADGQALGVTVLQQEMTAAVDGRQQQAAQRGVEVVVGPAQAALLVSSTTAVLEDASGGARATVNAQVQTAGAAAVSPPNPPSLGQPATSEVAVDADKRLTMTGSGKRQRVLRPRAGQQQEQQLPLPLTQPRQLHVQSWNIGTGVGGPLLLHPGGQIRMVHQVLQQQVAHNIGSGTSSNIHQWLAARPSGAGAVQFMPLVMCGPSTGGGVQSSTATVLQPQQAGAAAVSNDLAGMVATIQGPTAAFYGDRTPHVPHAVAAAQYHLAYGTSAADGPSPAAAAVNRMLASAVGGQLSQQQQQVMQLLVQLQHRQQQQQESVAVPANICFDFPGTGSDVGTGMGSVVAALQQVHPMSAASQPAALAANAGSLALDSEACGDINTPLGAGAPSVVVPGTVEPAAVAHSNHCSPAPVKDRAAAPEQSCKTTHLPGIAPLELPDVISEEDCWKMAQAQPWIIQHEADRARQLLTALVSGSNGGVLSGSSGTVADTCQAQPTAAGAWPQHAAGGTDRWAVSAVGGCQPRCSLGGPGTERDGCPAAQDTLCAMLHTSAAQGASAAATVSHGVVTGVVRQQSTLNGEPVFGTDKQKAHQQVTGAAGSSGGGACGVLRVLHNN